MIGKLSGEEAPPEVVLRIDVGLRSNPARIDRIKLVAKKSPARIAVARLNTLAVPRLDMNPAPPPIPRPPPSDRCSSTRPIMTSTIMRWITMMTVCMNGSNKFPAGGSARTVTPHIGSRGRLYTIPRGIATRMTKNGKLQGIQGDQPKTIT